jgi:hypothetical protein
MFVFQHYISEERKMQVRPHWNGGAVAAHFWAGCTYLGLTDFDVALNIL